MAGAWNEVITAKREKRKELTLQGPEISERIEKDGLDGNIFKLPINYLVITRTCLPNLPADVGKLSDLMRLSLSNNHLTSIPAEIGKLEKLKLLDLSNNQITELPSEINNLKNLETLNVSVNQLSVCPPIDNLSSLAIFDVSYNQMTALPEGICSNHEYLKEIRASHNSITELPEELNTLERLTVLDVSNNKLSTLPLHLCECSKLKDFNGRGNCITERRLAKTVEQGQMKGMMSYLSTELEKKIALEKKGEKKPKPKKKKKAKTTDDGIEDIIKDMINILRFPAPEENGIVVSVQAPVLTVRPYIVCCIVRQLNLKKSLNMFKHFIQLQTKLHDTICDKRQTATIATHDLKSIKQPLRYTAEFPQLLMITPLFKTKEASAERLFGELIEEAEALRKEKKRNVVSGIHKYLELLKDKVQYPCILDSSDTVISFPPITNSDKTKISNETTDILIEVTSPVNLDSCKRIMDQVLKEMLNMGLGGITELETDATPTDHGAGEIQSQKKPKVQKTLTVEQVKIVDQEGQLKVIYPSRTDLDDESFEVIRNYD